MPPKPNILLLFNNTPFQPVVDRETLARLGEIGQVFQPEGPFKSWTPDQLRQWLAEADVVITSWASPKLTAELLAAAPRLKFIGHAAGTVAPYVDPAAWDRGIVVVSGNASMANQVAEWAVTLAILALRRWHYISRQLAQARTWGKVELSLHSDSLTEQPVGVIGFGQVARLAIPKFIAFNCPVSVWAPEPAADIAHAGASKVELDALLGASRVVSLHAPLNDQTCGLIGGRELALMPDRAVLVNTARGKLVDHEALIRECRTGRLSAALDVTDPEPLPPESPLWQMDNVTISPHMAGPVPCRRREFGRMVLADLEAFLAGRPLGARITAEHARQMTQRDTP